MAHDATSIGSQPSPRDIHDTVLHRVRSLLAKAESSTFDDEAAAFTAKAQQLMARHAIDRAMLADSGRGPRVRPGERTIALDAPYAREKFFVLAAVASANDCKAVLDREREAAVVLGFDDDLRTVELLFTSLLVQATSSMLANGTSAATRRRRYRQSFLIAFAARIRERLQEARDSEVRRAEGEHGAGVLPVLASRAAEVDAALSQRFPRLSRTQATVRDRAGWLHGTDAGTRADLGNATSVDGAKRRRLPR